MGLATKPPILLVHGMFMTPHCWTNWVARYGSRGLEVQALPWPGRDPTVGELRRKHPDPKLALLGFPEVIEHYAKIVAARSDRPILIGHSMGGLVVQELLSRGLGAAGVAIDSAPPRGVSTSRFSFLRSNWHVVNPFLSSSKPYALPFPRFQYAFANGMPLEQQRAIFEAEVVPESLRVPRESRLRNVEIDFTKPHPPLLLIAGSTDHIIPAVLNHKNYERYRSGSSSTVEIKEFPGRNHFGVIGGPGWEEVADFAFDWAVARGSAT